MVNPTSATRVERFTATSADGQVFDVEREIDYIPRAKNRDPFVYLYMEGIDRALAAHLTAREYQVWMEILRRSRINESFDLTNVKLATHLGMDPSNVSRAVSRLEVAGLITRPERGAFALNPEASWRGSAPLRATAIEAENWDEA